jgi:hypothetical protein
MTERDETGGGEVLRSLPSRRPQRRSPRRDAASKPAAASKPSARKAPAAPAKPKRAAPATKRAAPAAKLKGVRPSAATKAASSRPGARPANAPEGVELLGTAVQAAGELAQFGLTLGTKALRSAVKRIPHP